MAQFAGNQGDLTVGATAMEVTEWTASESADIHESTDKASSGYKEHIAGNRVLEVSGTAVYDDSIHQGDPPTVYAGLSASVDLDVDGTYSISGTIIFTSCNYKSPVNGIVELDFSGTSNGQYYLPGESTS